MTPSLRGAAPRRGRVSIPHRKASDPSEKTASTAAVTVSIPHRKASDTDFSDAISGQAVFQFLIGKLVTRQTEAQVRGQHRFNSS